MSHHTHIRTEQSRVGIHKPLYQGQHVVVHRYAQEIDIRTVAYVCIANLDEQRWRSITQSRHAQTVHQLVSTILRRSHCHQMRYQILHLVLGNRGCKESRHLLEQRQVRIAEMLGDVGDIREVEACQMQFAVDRAIIARYILVDQLVILCLDIHHLMVLDRHFGRIDRIDLGHTSTLLLQTVHQRDQHQRLLGSTKSIAQHDIRERLQQGLPQSLLRFSQHTDSICQGHSDRSHLFIARDLIPVPQLRIFLYLVTIDDRICLDQISQDANDSCAFLVRHDIRVY